MPVNLPNILAYIGAVTAILALVVLIAGFLQKSNVDGSFKRNTYVLYLGGLWLMAVTFVMMWLGKIVAPNGGDVELLRNMAIGAVIVVSIPSAFLVMQIIRLRKERTENVPRSVTSA